MAKYFKTVEAQKYTGDLKAIKRFIGIQDAEYDESSRILFIPEELAKPNGVRWTAQVGDYVVKTDNEGFIVYKPARFEKEFQLASEVTGKANTNVTANTKSTKPSDTDDNVDDVDDDDDGTAISV